MKKILTTTFCIAAILGLLDTIITLSERLSKSTVNAGELDVESVIHATEIFVNEGGVLESRADNIVHDAVLTEKDVIPNLKEKNDPYTVLNETVFNKELIVSQSCAQGSCGTSKVSKSCAQGSCGTSNISRNSNIVWSNGPIRRFGRRFAGRLFYRITHPFNGRFRRNGSCCN